MKIHRTSFILATGAMFIIPRGNTSVIVYMNHSNANDPIQEIIITSRTSPVDQRNFSLRKLVKLRRVKRRCLQKFTLPHAERLVRAPRMVNRRRTLNNALRVSQRLRSQDQEVVRRLLAAEQTVRQPKFLFFLRQSHQAKGRTCHSHELNFICTQYLLHLHACFYLLVFL